MAESCTKCQGTGTVNKQTCPYCRGTGKTSDPKLIKK